MFRALFVVMCGCGSIACQPAPVEVDAGADAGTLDAGVPDAGLPDAGQSASTLLTATLGTRTATFTRAQHGLEPTGLLYVEAHFGGDPACPTQNSPTPDRTLVISGLNPMHDGGVQSYADGVRVTLLDFTGALTQAPFVRAASVRATPGAVNAGTEVTFALEAGFDGGTLSGSFTAPHCASLDGP